MIASGPSQTAGNGPRIADRDERRQVEARAMVPALGHDFRTDARPDRRARWPKVGREGVIAGPLTEIRDLTELDHRIAAKVAQVAAGTRVHPLFVDLVEDLVEGRRRRVDLVAAADDQDPDAFLDRAERVASPGRPASAA